MTFDPPEIRSGLSETTVIVDVTDPRPELGLEVVTEVTAISGRIADPFARQTTYACAFDVSGPVEVCATATYVGGDMPQGDDPNVGVSYQYLGKPHIRLSAPVQCSETRCTTIICPEDKNACPDVSLTAEPMVVPDGGMATITVVADDPDDNPEALVTVLSATHGTIANPNASETTFTCDPAVGGIIEICVIASDGDSSCDVERCTTVRCPGDPLENTCPTIGAFTADPMTIPTDESMTVVRVDVVDPDEFPEPLRTELRSGTGTFVDRFTTETIFTCGDSGPVELCVEVTDGDPVCDKSRCITVQCPSTIPANVCPMLNVLNAGDSTIDPGEDTRTLCSFDATSPFPFLPCNQDADCPGGTCNQLCPGERCTWIQVRAQETDGLPLPVTLTLRALWGSFENTDNLPGPTNTVIQNATYLCDRPGDVEICVDATDGACLKTDCIEITCPADVPPP